MASDRFQCPKCKKLHEKRYTYGTATPVRGGLSGRSVGHADVTCACGERLDGFAIGAGLYDVEDDPLRPLPAIARGILGAALAGLIMAGLTWIFVGGAAPVLVGGGFFILTLVLFFTGNLRMKP